MIDDLEGSTVSVEYYTNMSLSYTQLDPQTLQGKDWQRTVIPMNGVSRLH